MLNRFITIIFLFLPSLVFAKPYIFAGYGLSNYSDEKKSDIELTLRKTPLKFGIGQRYGHLEIELQYRMANSEADFEHDNTKNTLIHKSSAILAGVGIYTIPALRLQGGIAFQSVKETLAEEVSTIQEEDINDKYNITNGTSLGTYMGLDLHLVTLWKAKVLLSGVAYFTPSFGGAKEYEVMVGFKIPFGGGGRSSSFNPMKSMSDR
jgi:hypothetical protein